MNNDTSDEAYWDWAQGQSVVYPFGLEIWREAIRRCEAQMEERERKAFEVGWDAGMDELDMDEVWQAFKEAQK